MPRNRQPSQGEQQSQLDAQFEGELPVLGHVVQPGPGAAVLQGAEGKVEDHRAGGDGGGSDGRPPRIGRVDGERKRHNAGDVGDSNLRRRGQDLRPGQPQGIDDR
ncbi:MAG: hypothetical protein NVS3B6_03340 [Pseudarthrobacter sp.]